MSISKADDELRALYEAGEDAKRKQCIEEAAYLIYERCMRFARPETPEWVVGGNSLAQDEARATASKILFG